VDGETSDRDPDEYAGVQARYYDQYYNGLDGDVQFYLEEAVLAGGPVLELGCGTGRTLFPVAAAGIQITGVERSRDMLARARERLAGAPSDQQQNAEILLGDMRDFSLGRSFNLVSLPYRTFQHLLEPDDQYRALEAIHQHLEPGGRLVFNIFDPTRDLAARAWREGQEWEADTEFEDPVTGSPIRVRFARTYDLQAQHLHQDLAFEECDAAGSVTSSHLAHLTLRYTNRYEMEYLLDLCGFELLALYGDFEGGDYPGYGEQIWVAERS